MFNFRTVSPHYSEAVNRRRSLDHDSESAPVFLDKTYIEYMMFLLFKIDIVNYINVKSILAKEFHIQPSEIDSMPAWEYELFMKQINEAVKEENKRNETEMEKSNVGDIKKMSSKANINKMQREAKSSFKMPNMGSFKMPKI